MASDILLLAHAGATLAMFGLIWFVQVVHYPLFALVGRDGFARYERANTRRTGVVVGPLMVVEAITAAGLLVFPPAHIGRELPAAGFALLLLIWGSTAALQVPAHRRLEQGFAAACHRRLTVSNWIRTGMWTLRAALALWLLRVG